MALRTIDSRVFSALRKSPVTAAATAPVFSLRVYPFGTVSSSPSASAGRSAAPTRTAAGISYELQRRRGLMAAGTMMETTAGGGNGATAATTTLLQHRTLSCSVALAGTSLAPLVGHVHAHGCGAELHERRALFRRHRLAFRQLNGDRVGLVGVRLFSAASNARRSINSDSTISSHNSSRFATDAAAAAAASDHKNQSGGGSSGAGGADAGESTSKTREQLEAERREEDARKAKHLRWSFYAFGISAVFIGTTLIMEYGKPQRDEEGNLIPDEYSKYPLLPQYLMRFYKEAVSFKKTIEEPMSNNLLPEPLKPPFIQPPYTLCLEFTGVLVHPEWSFGTGWRFKKRPGLNFFLEQVSHPLYEVVIYTKEQAMTANHLIDSLDTGGHIMYRLFKENTRYQDGNHIKELGALNRPLNRVIHVDWDESAFKPYRSNVIHLKKWAGNMDDRSLVDLAMFLRTIAESGVEDVRGILEYYSQFDDPLAAFRENQRKLAEHELSVQEQHKAKAPPAWSAFRPRY